MANAPRNPEGKIVPLTFVAELCADLRARGKRIVTTNGCFDILHYGHLSYLNEARKLGDVLICGLNSDASVRSLGKGDDRPIFPERVRAMQLAAVEAVDYVTVFNESTPERFLSEARPHLHVKGGDYRPEDLPERVTVEQGGGRIAILPLEPGFSTTAILDRLRS